MVERRTLVAATAIVAIILFVNLPLIGNFTRLLALDRLADASEDAPTHFLRVLHARDLYFPSGHHWGWDPSWYQGYVPFLLYPHLTHALLAILTLVLPIEPFRIFNAYTLFIYLVLPMVAAGLIYRRTTSELAILVAVWFGSVTAIGAGLYSVFYIGLLSQQAGVILFVVLCYDTILTRRLDRAAIWFGLIPLVHVHTAIVSLAVWCIAGIDASANRERRLLALRTWALSTVLAIMIALPTFLGLVHGWGSVGRSTSYPEHGGRDLFYLLWKGMLIAPAPIVAALALGIVVAFLRCPAHRRLEVGRWLALAGALVAVSVHKWSIGVSLVDRLASTVLHARSLAYAYTILVFVLVVAWQWVPRVPRILIVILTVAGIGHGWFIGRATASKIGVPGPTGSIIASEGMRDYRQVLDWVVADSKGEVTTISVAPVKPTALIAYEAASRSSLVLLEGHGAELTNVHNDAIGTRPEKITCNALKRQQRDYVVGYILGSRPGQRMILEKCLGSPPAYAVGQWWVFGTGLRWSNTPEGVTGFAHNPTWTELRWNLDIPAEGATVRLPIALTAPWLAEANDKPLQVGATTDGMMQVSLPGGARELHLRYVGFPGEWGSVFVAGSALVAGIVRSRRGSRAN